MTDALNTQLLHQNCSNQGCGKNDFADRASGKGNQHNSSISAAKKGSAEIYRAQVCDIAAIQEITVLAFEMYKSELDAKTPVKALSETSEDVLYDIKNNYVFVAKQEGKILGCIRIKLLSSDIAYIYRFSVHPDEHNAGIGSILIEKAIELCYSLNVAAITLHTNAKYFKLARYYYGKQFYIHSTTDHLGYIRALFVKNLQEKNVDFSAAMKL